MRVSPRNWALLLSLFIFISCQKQAPQVSTPLRIAFFDTAHCVQYLTELAPQNVELKLESSSYTQAQVCALPLDHPARHGDRVMAVFLRNLTPHQGAREEKRLPIHLYGLFNSAGQSSGAKWERALENARQQKVQLIYSAVATQEAFKWSEDISLIVASGQWGGRVQKNDHFYPHELIKNSTDLRQRSLVIGSYQMDDLHQEAWRDQSLLYPELIDYSFAQSESAARELYIQGSSHALGVAAGRSLSICRQELGSFKTLRQCLEKHTQTVNAQDGVLLKQF